MCVCSWRIDHHAGVVLACIHEIGAGLALKLKKPSFLDPTFPKRQAFPFPIYAIYTGICPKLAEIFFSVYLRRIADLFLRSNGYLIALKDLINGNKLLNLL